MTLFYVIFIFIITQKSAYGENANDVLYELPCNKLGPSFNDCINENLETAIRSLKDGNRHLGVIQLDPLIIDAIHIEHTLGSLDIDQRFSHIKVTGFSNSKISNTHFDLDKCQLYFESLTPLLISESEFRISGHFYLVPILGEGPSTSTINNLKGVHNVTCTRYTKKGAEHLRLTSYDIALKPEKIVYKFENILDENSQLNDEVHGFINSNALTIFKQGVASTEHAYKVIFMKIINKLLTKVPLNMLVQE